MSVHDLSSFCCSICKKSIPDRDLETLATIKLSEDKKGIEVICSDCLSGEGEKAPEKKGTLVIMSEFKIKGIT